MAVAAVELAESYRGRGRVHAMLIRWAPVAMVVVLGVITISAAVGGDAAMAVFSVLLILGGIGHLMFNPALRPKNVERSLEASRQVVARLGASN